MSKRILLILLIAGAVLSVVAVVIFIVKPFGERPSQQPPPLPDSRPFQPSDAVPKPIQPAETAPDTTDPAERERQAQEALKRSTMDLAGRAGTYSSVDGFASLRNVYGLVTSDVQTKLEAQRVSLAKQYPVFGPSWGRTFRPLSARILSGTPLLSSSQVTLEIQGQLIEERAGQAQSVKNSKITVTLVKQGAVWIASNLVEAELKL